MDEGKYEMKFKRWMRPQGLIQGGRWNVANKGKRDRTEHEEDQQDQFCQIVW